MAQFTEQTLEDIRQRVPIEELVREYVPGLKRAGRNWKACCPFHQEKTPSFIVSPERGTFHCFGSCSTGGDVFTFLMKVENLEFPEAVEKLATRAGVTLPKDSWQSSPQARERRRLLDALEFAREFYHGELMASPEALSARQYLEKRGLKAETVKAFQLGYAPRAGRGLLPAAAGKGYDAALLMKAGLAARREDGTYRDYFWGRVLYPIRNAKGETVGFGARVLGAGEPKYLNSPETPLFSKGRVLYGFFEGLSAVRKDRRVVLMEGYMDVLAAHQWGLPIACAPLGTAVTEDHATTLARYVEEVTFLFDPDAAGATAAMRGAEMLLERGLRVRVATVPGGLDPDELLMKSGRRGLDKCLEEGADLAEFRTVLSLKGRAGAFLEPEDKAKVAGEVLGTIARCPDQVLKREWVRRLSQKLDADEESLLLQLRRSGEPPSRMRALAPKAPAERAAKPVPAAEKDILLCLLRQPALALDDALVAEADLSDPRARAVFAAMRSTYGASEGGTSPARVLEALEGEARTLASVLLVDERALSDPAAVLSGIVGRARRERRLKELEPVVLRMAAEGGAGEGSAELKTEYMRLLSELKGTRRD
ncbi:MAG: DNA primase [Elusimicrobiota bacterium]|jgi:DNA primase